MTQKKPTKRPNSSSHGIIREELGSGITKRTRTRVSGPLNVEGLVFLKNVLEHTSNCPLAEMEATLRDFLREGGFPDDPTEGGKYLHRSHITPELAESEFRSGTWYAAAILDEISHARWFYELAADHDKKTVYHATLAGFQAGKLFQQARMKYLWEQSALRGESMIEANKKPRKDWLVKLAEKTYVCMKERDGKDPSAIDVIKNLEKNDAPKESFSRIINKIDHDRKVIEWTDRRGADRDTSFKAFANRMTILKKRIS